MKVIIQEFLVALKSSKLNNKWVKIAVALSTLIFIILIGKVLLFPSVEKGEVASSENMTASIELMHKVANGEDVEASIDTENIETTIQLFFAGANEASLDLFASVLDPYQIQNDFILKFEFSELENKYNEAMSRISRDGQIEAVDIVSSTRLIGMGKRRVVVDIHYYDLEKPVRASLIVESVEELEQHPHEEGTEHSHEDLAEYKQPYITSSVWDFIRLIEEGIE